MPLFTICNISRRCPQNVPWSFRSKYPTDHLLYHFENAEKHAVFMHVTLNVNELLLPTIFSRIVLYFYSSYLRYSAKKNICLVLIIMSIVLWFKSCVLNPISLNFWYTDFWIHTSEACTQKAAATWHVSKLSSLSCLIALKRSNTHKIVKSCVCEAKQLGNKCTCLY